METGILTMLIRNQTQPLFERTSQILVSSTSAHARRCRCARNARASRRKVLKMFAIICPGHLFAFIMCVVYSTHACMHAAIAHAGRTHIGRIRINYVCGMPWRGGGNSFCKTPRCNEQRATSNERDGHICELRACAAEHAAPVHIFRFCGSCGCEPRERNGETGFLVRAHKSIYTNACRKRDTLPHTRERATVEL